MEEQLPFPISVRFWNELPEPDRGFFCDDDYLPLLPDHAAQIGLLVRVDAARVFDWVFAGIPPGWPERDVWFKHEDQLCVRDCWNDPVGQSVVRRWLFDRGVPFRRTVYLIYERDRVVQTSWKMVVRYWDAFAWSVGYAMVAEVFVFGRHALKQQEQV